MKENKIFYWVWNVYEIYVLLNFISVPYFFFFISILHHLIRELNCIAWQHLHFYCKREYMCTTFFLMFHVAIIYELYVMFFI